MLDMLICISLNFPINGVYLPQECLSRISTRLAILYKIAIYLRGLFISKMTAQTKLDWTGLIDIEQVIY